MVRDCERAPSRPEMEITNAKEYATNNTQKLENQRASAWLLLPQA